MLPYIGLYLLILFLSLIENFKSKFFIEHKIFINFFGLSSLIIFMGFKYHVGGDWGTYVNFFNEVSIDHNFSFSDDIGFFFLNFFFKEINFSFYSINIFSAIIFIYGIHTVAKYYNNYWLFFLILLPYFIIVIGMGYTRQSISIGLALMAISILYKNLNIFRFFGYYLLIIAAITFHKSVIILLPLPLIFLKLNNKNLLLILLVLYLLFFVFNFIVLNDHIIHRLKYFFQNEYSSTGAYYRAIILSAFAFYYLAIGKFFQKQTHIKTLNITICFYILLFSTIIFISPSTVVFDRLLVYFYFIIPIIVSELLENMASHRQYCFLYLLLIALGVLFLWFWLLFADNSFSWLPYRVFYLNG